MSFAFAGLLAAVLVFVVWLSYRERQALREQNERLTRVIVAHGARPAASAILGGKPEPREPRKRAEDEPPPGTQPVGLDG